MSVIVFLVFVSAANATIGWLMCAMDDKPDKWERRGNPRSYR